MNSTLKFEDRLEGHRESLRVKAHGYLHNWADADDLVNDTFAHALRKKHLYKDDTNLRGWLGTLMFHLFINLYRKNKKRGNVVSLSVLDGYDLPIEADPAKALSHNEYSLGMREALSKLHPKYRVVLEAVVLDGLKYKEVAAKLDLPLGTVMSRLSRARANMKSLLGSTYRQAA